MVVDSHAIVQPRAVMVETLHTSVADGAVARARGAQDETVWAHLTRVDFLKQFQEVVGRLQISRVFCRSNEEAEGNYWTEGGDCVGKDII